MQPTGSKYIRNIHNSNGELLADVYDVLKAFGVTCPARAHAIKKLLCAGLRDKGDELNDVYESIDACIRATELLRDSMSRVAKAEHEKKLMRLKVLKHCGALLSALSAISLVNANEIGPADGKPSEYLRKEIQEQIQAIATLMGDGDQLVTP